MTDRGAVAHRAAGETSASSAELTLGYSPCPNDTFMFHGLVHGRVPFDGPPLRPVLLDIEELNRRALGTEPLAVTKLSIGALAAVSDRYAVLPSGAALGRGVGPLVVTRPRRGAPEHLAELGEGRRVAVPGERTTAYLLLRLFAGTAFEAVPMRFDRVMDAVSNGAVDAGLIIHESRFTYAGRGLVALADLGELWEADTGLPLPLGVIAAARHLPRALVERLGAAIRASVELARREPGGSRDYVRAHAREMDDTVCARHIALYVTEWSIDLGDDGVAAIDALLARGRSLGLLAPGPAPWL